MPASKYASAAGPAAFGENKIWSTELDSEEEDGVGEAERVGFAIIMGVGRAHALMRRSVGVRKVVGGAAGSAGTRWKRVIRERRMLEVRKWRVGRNLMVDWMWQVKCPSTMRVRVLARGRARARAEAEGSSNSPRL